MGGIGRGQQGSWSMAAAMAAATACAPLGEVAEALSFGACGVTPIPQSPPDPNPPRAALPPAHLLSNPAPWSSLPGYYALRERHNIRTPIDGRPDSKKRAEHCWHGAEQNAQNGTFLPCQPHKPATGNPGRRIQDSTTNASTQLLTVKV